MTLEENVRCKYNLKIGSTPIKESDVGKLQKIIIGKSSEVMLISYGADRVTISLQ